MRAVSERRVETWDEEGQRGDAEATEDKARHLSHFLGPLKRGCSNAPQPRPRGGERPRPKGVLREGRGLLWQIRRLSRMPASRRSHAPCGVFSQGKMEKPWGRPAILLCAARAFKGIVHGGDLAGCLRQPLLPGSNLYLRTSRNEHRKIHHSLRPDCTPRQTKYTGYQY